MLRRVQDWIRGGGGKKNTSYSPTSKTKKKKKDKARPRSRTEGAIPSSSDDFDEFRPNDVNAFDLVLTTNPYGSDKGSLSNGEIAAPAADSSQNPGSQSTELGDGSVESLVDLVSLTEKRLPDEENLSLDAMETLELFDSVVNGLEVSQEYDNPGGTKEQQKDEPISGDDMTVGSNTELNVTISDVKDKMNKTIDYNQVIGETQETSDSGSRAQNWEVSEVSESRKSFRFVTKDIYLPSPELKRRTGEEAPELPPADYPQTDDDDEGLFVERYDEASDETARQSQPVSAPLMTSFSAVPHPTTSASPNVERMKGDGQTESFSLSQATSSKDTDPSPEEPVANGFESPPRRISSPTVNGNVTSWSKTRNSRANSSPTPKRPKPRVTSFKSSSLPTKITVPPITERVKKFERSDAGTGGEF